METGFYGPVQFLNKILIVSVARVEFIDEIFDPIYATVAAANIWDSTGYKTGPIKLSVRPTGSNLIDLVAVLITMKYIIVPRLRPANSVEQK